MDIVVEQVVKKGKSIRDLIIKICIIIITMAIPFLFYAIAQLTALNYFVIVGIFVFLFGIYGAWYFIVSLKLEYEYCVTNDDLTIDKVIAKRRRKNMISINIKDIYELVKVDDENLDKRKYDKYIFANSEISSENAYACSFNSKKYGKCLLIFEPNEKILNAMKHHLKKDIILKIFYKR